MILKYTLGGVGGGKELTTKRNFGIIFAPCCPPGAFPGTDQGFEEPGFISRSGACRAIETKHLTGG
jgi:hypothetical protein